MPFTRARTGLDLILPPYPNRETFEGKERHTGDLRAFGKMGQNHGRYKNL